MENDVITPKYTVFDLGYEKCLAKTDSFYDDQGANADKVTDSLPSILIGGGGLIGNITMVDGFMQSSNYVAGSTGWKLTETTAYLPSIDLSGYLLATGGAYKTAATGSRVEIFPDANTGIIAYDSGGSAVLTVLVGGTNEGDVIMGGASAYAKWDKSAGTFTVIGAIQTGVGSVVNGEYIDSLSVGKLTSGTINSQSIQLNDGGTPPSVIEYDASSKGATTSADTSLTVAHTCSGTNRLLVAGITANPGVILPAYDNSSKGKTNSANTELTLSHTTGGENRLLTVGVTGSVPEFVKYDATSHNASAGASSLTASHTCSGTNRLLVVGVFCDAVNDLPTGVTYNGVAMTNITYGWTTGVTYSMWYLIAPDSGTHDIVASWSGNGNRGLIASSYNGVAQTGALDTYSQFLGDVATDTLACSLTTAQANEVVVSFCGFGTNADYPMTPNGDQAEIYEQTIPTNIRNHAMGYNIKTTAGNTGASWSISSAKFGGIIQASFKPVTDGVISLDISGVTYGGTAMTKITSKKTADGLQESSLWYLIAPATGANNVVVTYQYAANIGAIAASYSKMIQTGVLDSSSNYQVTSTTVSTSLETAQNNEIVVSFAALTDTLENTELTVGASQTQRQSQDTSDSVGHAFADKVATTAGTITSSWTTTHNEGTLLQASFKKLVDIAYDPTGVTYNGVAMTKITSLNSTDDLQSNSLWYLIAPATGNNNLVATFTNIHNIGAIVVSYEGVAQTGALDVYNSDSGSNHLLIPTLTTTTQASLIVAFPSWQANLATIGTITLDPEQTQRQSQDTSNGYAHAFGDKIVAPTGSTFSGWQTEDAENWLVTLAAFKRIAAVAGEGTTYLACGKWAFNNNDDGFIFGRQAGVTKVIVGSQEEHLSIIGGVVDNTLKLSRYTAVNANVQLLVSGGVYNTTQSTSYVKVKELKIGRRGDYDVRWDLTSGVASSAELRLCRRTGMGVGGPTYGSEEVIEGPVVTTSGTQSVITHLTDLEPYDLVRIYAKCNSDPGPESARVGTFDLYVDRFDEIFTSVYTLQA